MYSNTCNPHIDRQPEYTLEEMYYIATRIDDEFRDNPLIIKASECNSYEELQEFCRNYSDEIEKEKNKTITFKIYKGSKLGSGYDTEYVDVRKW